MLPRSIKDSRIALRANQLVSI